MSTQSTVRPQGKLPVSRPPIKPAASVIVLTYNARGFVEHCISALLAQTQPDFEIVLVDNASADGTADFVRSRFPEVCVISSPTNGGYGAGNNIGAANASAETLVFLNPDAIPTPDWLEQLLNGMRQYGRNLVTSRIVLQSDSSRLNSAGNLIHYLGQSFCRGMNEPACNYERPELVSGASGAACAISRELFDRVGGFDPNIFMYHDDVDLSVRSLLAGEQCMYLPNAVAAHDYKLKIPPAKWTWIEGYKFIVLLKVLRFSTFALLLPILLLVDLATFAYLAKLGPEFVSAKLRGYQLFAQNILPTLAAHRSMQRVRVLSDRELLGALAADIPYEQLLSPRLASLAHSLVDPALRAYRRAIQAVVHW